MALGANEGATGALGGEMGEAREVAQRYYDLFASGDMDAAAKLFVDGCATVTPAGSFAPEEHADFARMFKSALPDARMEAVRAVESGNEVFFLARFRGTHSGDLVTPQGTVPSSGNAIDVRFADYFRARTGASLPTRCSGTRST